MAGEAGATCRENVPFQRLAHLRVAWDHDRHLGQLMDGSEVPAELGLSILAELGVATAAPTGETATRAGPAPNGGMQADLRNDLGGVDDLRAWIKRRRGPAAPTDGEPSTTAVVASASSTIAMTSPSWVRRMRP